MAATLTECGKRLLFVVRELGYVDGQGIQLARLTADINRRALGNVTAGQLQAILHRGREIMCDELIVLCEGLDVEPAEILYGEAGQPERRRRPPGQHLMDMLEPRL